jgi:hypothetical protein
MWKTWTRSRWSALIVVGLMANAAPLMSSVHSDASTASGTGRTHIVVIDPVARVGLAAGYRVVRTDRIRGDIECTRAETDRGDLYRCFDPRLGARDPCWLDPADGTRHTAVCPISPWSHHLIRERLQRPLIRLRPRKIDRARPWGLQLANGQRAALFLGAHDTYRGRVIDYTIAIRVNGHYKLKGGVLRGLHRGHQPWTADIVTYHPKSNRYTSAGRIQITRALYADSHAPTGP